ncbi:MAG: tRNA (guanosine(37)-N1)-methyltransferase TrmD [Solirubrobacteraceae bacterium]
MRIDFISLFPEMLESTFSSSINNRAIKKEIVEVEFHQLRDYSENKHKKVDDYQYGGGAGMVMSIDPIFKCIEKLKKDRDYDEIIYLSPDGELLNQGIANELSLKKNLVFLCGHYKGIDQRVRDHLITREISIGDYVLTGGELAALVLADSIIRLIPGVLSDETSALTDSFQDNLLSPPIYTRPKKYKDWEVPEILLSGDEKKIEKWKLEKSIERTRLIRPNLIDN